MYVSAVTRNEIETVLWVNLFLQIGTGTGSNQLMKIRFYINI